MKLNGTQSIARSPSEFWEMMMDPEVLQACMPGCEALDPTGENAFRVKLKVGIGPVKGRFSGTVKLVDVVEPVSYKLLIKAKGTTGFVNGSSILRLLPKDDGRTTELVYESEAQVGGILASIGARLFQSIGKTFANQFFQNLADLEKTREI